MTQSTLVIPETVLRFFRSLKQIYIIMCVFLCLYSSNRLIDQYRYNKKFILGSEAQGNRTKLNVLIIAEPQHIYFILLYFPSRSQV